MYLHVAASDGAVVVRPHHSAITSLHSCVIYCINVGSHFKDLNGLYQTIAGNVSMLPYDYVLIILVTVSNRLRAKAIGRVARTDAFVVGAGVIDCLLLCSSEASSLVGVVWRSGNSCDRISMSSRVKRSHFFDNDLFDLELADVCVLGGSSRSDCCPACQQRRLRRARGFMSNCLKYT
jgi:hypothetical protein